MQDESRPWLSLDRRTFLKTASLATAAGAWAGNAAVFAQTGSSYQHIAVPKDAHPAVHSAASILAEALSLSSKVIHTYHHEPPRRAFTITLAIRETQGVPALLSGAIERDGYAVLARDGGLLVCGARPRSLLRSLGTQSGLYAALRRLACEIQRGPTGGHDRSESLFCSSARQRLTPRGDARGVRPAQR